MYLKRGATASYDIQLSEDATGKVNALKVLSLLSPEADLAATILTNVATRINIPGVDLTKIIDKDLVLADAGLILRQHQPLFRSVSIDDLYGTIALSQVLQLAEDLLPIFPKSLSIPKDLPDLTLIIRSATGAGEKVRLLQ